MPDSPGPRPAAANPPNGPTPHPKDGTRAVARKARVRRAFLALSTVAIVEIVGTLGFHWIEGMGPINAFYFESMLATGQGPPFPLNSDTGKIFASVMGFVSVGSTLTAVVFAFGPLLSRVWRGLVRDVEDGAHRLGHDIETEIQRLEDDVR